MSIVNRRSRTVNFRLSFSEYEIVQGVCLAEGARSLSDFARNAVLERVKAHQYYPTLAERLDALQSALYELLVKVNASRAAGGPTDPQGGD